GHSAGDDACGSANNHAVIDGCSTDQLIVVDDQNSTIPPVNQMLVSLGDDASHGLCIVTELIRPHPLRCWGCRLGAHNRVHHLSRRSAPMVPVIVARMPMHPTHITNGIDSVNIGTVAVINNNA